MNLVVRYALNDASLEDLIDPEQLFAFVDQEQLVHQKVPLARQSQMLS